MKAEPKKVSIEGQDYTLAMWPVDKSAEMLAWMISTFGPTFNHIYKSVGATEGMKNDVEMGLHFLEVVSRGLSSVLDPKDYAKKLREIVSDCLCNNAPINYQIHFSGKLVQLHMLVKEVLQYQYQDFLDVALAHRS